MPKKLMAAASLVALPIVFFYTILARFAVNIPNYDDYGAILKFLNQLTQAPALSGKFSYLLAAQHNEYKVLTTEVIVWLQHAIFGTVNLAGTCALGDLLVLLLGWLLWKMFLPREKDISRRLLLFAPVSLLLFQFNYAEVMDWAMPCLQCVGVVVFSLAAIYLLVRGTRGGFWGAVAMLILAVSSLANAFLVVPVGIFILLVDRRYMRLALWLAATGVCISGYAYRYNIMSSQADAGQSVFHSILHLRVQYIIAFMGGALFYPHMLSFGLGLAIALYFVYMFRRGYHRKNPLVAYCLLFLFLTSIGVAGIRSDFGLAQATSSRYRIYCDLLLIFVWFSVVEEWVQHQKGALRQNRLLRVALALCLLFSSIMDGWGIHLMAKRHKTLVNGMALYEHPQTGQPAGPILPMSGLGARNDEFNNSARAVLGQSMQLGIYQPPAYEPVGPH